MFVPNHVFAARRQIEWIMPRGVRGNSVTRNQHFIFTYGFPSRMPESDRRQAGASEPAPLQLCFSRAADPAWHVLR
jgi:hypothetical protein